jgi:geranylgeranyl pyrophosphate synthase
MKQETNSALAERPNQQQAAIAAVEVAAARGLPLAADFVHPPQCGPQRDVGNGYHAPHQAPWDELPAEVMEKARSAEVLSSLESIAPRMATVEAEIERLITTPIKLIADVASHTMSAGGKRLRPTLTLLAAQLCGDEGETPNNRVATCAAAIELTHMTSLLHDDVVDEADTRRGRPTARLQWGNATSVLVGDYLFAQVFVTASQQGFGELMQPLAEATAQMCAGELLETQTRGYGQMSEAQYLEIIALKTASLVECACRLGALAMNAGEEACERLARFGHDVGMAFQIVDDVLDVTASAGRLGKPVGHDIREGDVTLPMLRALQVGEEHERSELTRILDMAAQGHEVDDDEVRRALEILRRGDAIAYSRQQAQAYISSAKQQLEGFAPSPARAMLHDIADYVMTREK